MADGIISASDAMALQAVFTLVHSLFGQDHLGLDWAARLLVEVNPLKFGLQTVVALYVWLRLSDGYRVDPVRAFRGVVGVILAMGLGRAAQNFLPSSPRPRIAMPDFPFPSLDDLDGLADWSSMPSDTAALAFALTAVVWAYSRRLGVLMALWSIVVTCLPRLYFGYHHASDLIVGAALGAGTVALALSVPLPSGVTASVGMQLRQLNARAPTGVLLAFFVLGAECTQAFEFTRTILRSAGQVAQVWSTPADVGTAAYQPQDGLTDPRWGPSSRSAEKQAP